MPFFGRQNTKVEECKKPSKEELVMRFANPKSSNFIIDDDYAVMSSKGVAVILYSDGTLTFVSKGNIKTLDIDKIVNG